jgi:uncharacterized repeat protein (TIGR04138 family)
MHTVHFDEIVERILAHDNRYKREGYAFVREALDFTQQRIHKGSRDRRDRKDRHVTGQQLLEGIREYALQSFGPMSLFVLEEWGLQRCDDFGEIVFNLVEYGQGMFGKTDDDSRDDFKNAYAFFDAFRLPFLPGRDAPKPTIAKSH